MSQQRLERLNSLVCSKVNELLLTKSKDPRLEGVTVTKAIASGDLRTVRVFYSLIGDEERLAEADRAWKKAAGFVRSRLATILDQKHTPRLLFERDMNLAHAERVNEILRQVIPEKASPSQTPAGLGRDGLTQGDSPGEGTPKIE
ncbi:MAG: 30S ribosome-binding factor RbfA [Deltaproteobacteria bacterium]|jgi:ribosome-binding factor A|nr:30S ribosome-binding factor RbfA [Deltaproteobacteria bacterium]